MGMLAAVNAIALSPQVRDDLGRGESTLDKVGRFADALPGVDAVCVLSDRDASPLPGARVVTRPRWTARDLFAALEEQGRGFEHVVYFYADCPFLNAGIASGMIGDHLKYFADYSFADGYPYGVAPEILRVEALPALKALASEDPLARDTVFETIRKDINTYDIETRIAPDDMRLLRLVLAADGRRNTLLLRRLEAAGLPADETAALALIRAQAAAHRTLPAFFNIQIVEGCPQNCSYCPYPAMRGPALGARAEMAPTDFAAILDQVQGFCGDAVVSVSLWGEPSLHTRFLDLALDASGRDGIELVIETSGVGWDRAVLHHIAERAKKPPRWIVSLDAHSPQVYAAMRGEGYDEAHRTVAELSQLFPAAVHVQAVRTKDNEEDLEAFYRHWKATLKNVIIQKYSRFAGVLPDRRVTDLSPLKRFPCWHLKRDVAVLLDGTVPLCREDIRRETVLGNLLREPLAVLWERGEAPYLRHLREDYPAICAGCDEYYTFNF
jgi:spiro-SPASM protein